ncbi:MAG TPA: TasA family protein [Actinomycetota bacterium]
MTDAHASLAGGRRERRTGAKIGLTMLILALLGAVVGFGTFSAFSATTENPGNAFDAGTVSITDDDSGTAMLSLANAKPGDSDAACIVVTYMGTLPATVRLYGTTGGTGLDQYLDLTVTRGTLVGASFDSCAGFTPDAGGGVVYSGTMDGYPDAYGAALVDPDGSWTSGESRAYRFEVSVQDDSGAQGLNASQSFTWEARNT